MRVGAIDCGTNSIRLLVADVGPEGLVDLERRIEIVRLGQGIDATGVIAPDALERTFAASARYAQVCDDLGVERVRFVATSASRDARNADEFVAGVRRVFGERDVTPEVVTGLEEASLSFRGATGSLASAGLPGPYLVVDLGGGSTEFVRGDATVAASISTDIGCVRLSERHLTGDPASRAEIDAALADIDAALDVARERVGFDGVATLVGLAGTVTTVTAHTLGLQQYDREAIHLAQPSVDATLAACADLVGRTRGQRLELGFMHPGRADVIGAGALVWSRIVESVAAASPGVGLVTSEHDILDGIALSVADADRSTEQA